MGTPLYLLDINQAKLSALVVWSRWDCITINDVPVTKRLFSEVEKKYINYSKDQDIKASEFELLTATAFDIFTREKVDVAVVEVGMGGRLDSTNVLTNTNVLVTVISKISLDHQSWLGNTLEEIAREKAGILKPGVPCIIDHTNDPSVLSTIAQRRNFVKALATPLMIGIVMLPCINHSVHVHP